MTSKEKTYLAIGLAGAAAVAALAVAAKKPAPLKKPAPPRPYYDLVARAIVVAAYNAGELTFNPMGAIARFFPRFAPYYPSVSDMPALATAIVTQAVAMGGNTVVDAAGNVTIEFAKGVLKNPLSSLVGWTVVLGALGGAVWFFAPRAQRKAQAYRIGAPAYGSFG